MDGRAAKLESWPRALVCVKIGVVEHGPMVCDRSMVNLDGSGSLASSKGMLEHLYLRGWSLEKLYTQTQSFTSTHSVYFDVRLSQDMGSKDCDCNLQ